MGMAASQARFLGLTARKNNIEYEGQQVNQQRTTLANQSANYYNNLLGMKVPTPPSVADYTKTVYSFNDGALSNQITSMIAQQGGTYLISYLSSYEEDFAPVKSLSRTVVSIGSDIEGEQLYEDFINGTVGGCYTTLMDRTQDESETVHTQIRHLAHVVNHMLPAGTYTTSDGDTVDVLAKATDSGSNNGHYWTKPKPPYGGDATAMDKIANMIDGKNVQQKLIDLLYNTHEIIDLGKKTVNNNPEYKDTLDSLRSQLEEIVAIDLKAALSATYTVGNSELRIAGALVDATYNTDYTVNNYFGEDPYLKSLTSREIDALIAEEKVMINMLNEKYGENTWMVRYVKNETTGGYEAQYYSREELKVAKYNENSESISPINYYHLGKSTFTDEIKGVTARLEKDTTGRVINITLNSNDPVRAVTYAVTTSTITDQAAYDDAMNQYEFDKYQYEQTITEINAKIEIVQVQDKNLELRLKQLDTEQKAITQEMDAVQKVVEKNVESTFKTFG